MLPNGRNIEEMEDNEMKIGLRKIKTKLKISKAYFYAPYVPIYLVDEERYFKLLKQFFKDACRNEIFEEMED